MLSGSATGATYRLPKGGNVVRVSAMRVPSRDSAWQAGQLTVGATAGVRKGSGASVSPTGIRMMPASPVDQ